VDIGARSRLTLLAYRLPEFVTSGVRSVRVQGGPRFPAGPLNWAGLQTHGLTDSLCCRAGVPGVWRFRVGRRGLYRVRQFREYGYDRVTDLRGSEVARRDCMVGA
jgi:hypothetical protein